MNLLKAFELSAAKAPEKTAVFWGDSEVSYQSVSDQARRVGAALADRGVRPGDRVGVWMKNRPEFLSALYGAFHAGAVAVPINNFLTPSEVAYISADAGLKALLTEEGLREGAEAVAAEVEGLSLIEAEQFAGLAAAVGGEEGPRLREENDLAVIIYTSGTTGRPKGAMLSHANLLHNVDSCRRVLDAVEGDRFVLLLPMFHSFMLCVCILLPLTVGGSIVLIKSLHPPKNIVQEIIARKGSIMPAIPPLFRALASSPPPVPLPLRLAVSGAAPLPAEILEEFTKKMGIPLLEGYGLSEASPVVSMNPIAGQWKPGSIGLPIFDVEVRFVDEAGREVPPGEAGELCVRGGNVMQGYWNRPEATAESIQDGWLRTGDIGHKDEDGYLYITDRKKDMLLVNGINVYPREIEERLYRFPGVKDAAVVGKKDPRKGEQPVAFVVMNEGSPQDDGAILGFLKESLAAYKVPRRVVFLDALPRNATGKVLKTALRERPEIAG